ncbi:MAG: CHAT domain-containing protein [Tenacibaculum sp.]|nr:CHAT domain-containing protein [Tenacibaculum sp.]
MKNIKQFILLLGFLFFSFNGKSQNFLSHNLIKSNSLTEQKADSILAFIREPYIKANIARKFSRVFYKKDFPDFNLAYKYGKIEVDLIENELLDKNKNYHTSVFRLGIYSKKNKKFDEAILLFTKASKLNIYIKRKAQAFCNLGDLYYIKGLHRKSVNFYSKGLDLLKSHGKPVSFVAHSMNLSRNINRCENQDDLATCLKYLKLSESLLVSNPQIKNSQFLQTTLNIAFGNVYFKTENFHKAFEYYNQIINESKRSDDKYNLALAYLNLTEMKLNQKANNIYKYIQRSLKYSNKLEYNDKNSFIINATFLNTSKYYLNQKKLQLSLSYSEKTIQNYCKVSKEEDIKPQHLTLNNNKNNTLKALNLKISALLKLYQKEHKQEYLSQIIKSVNISNQLVDLILRESTETVTKLFWKNDVSKIYSYGALAAYYLKDHSLMLNYLEKNKAFLLTQSIKQNNLASQLSYSTKSEDLLFRKNIIELENKKLANNKKLQDSLFDLKLKYQKFQDSIKIASPEYFEERNNIQPISLKNLSSSLNKKSLIISYDLVEQYNSKKYDIIGLFISKDKSTSFKLELEDEQLKLFSKYKQLISRPLTRREELDKFKKVSSKLYSFLFPNKEVLDLINDKDLVFITNGELQNIPIESLNTQKDSLKYLIEDHNISYAYSASFLDFNNSLERTTSKNIAAFAPISFQNSNLKPLDATSSEIEAINKEISTDIYSQTNATKNNFLNTSSDYKILHLATHATSSNNPAIYFSKDTLKLHELYTHKTNADLVVLSACESNLGEIKKGEGVFSLSRGFFYSGTKSVISSLWNVNDVSTADIMKNFYKNLNNHQSKSEALNNAKRTYLKEHSLSEKSPYYWASFVLIGDTSPTYPSPNYLIYILGFIGLFSIILFFFKKRG